MEISRPHIDFLHNAAQRRRAAGDLLGASVFLDELLRIEPDHPEALMSLATIQITDNPHSAALLCGRIIKQTPNNVAAWSLLGQAVSTLSRADEAVQAFARAVQLDPNDANLQSNLSVALMRAGNPWAAVDAAKRAMTLNPKLPEAYSSLGHAYNVLEMSEEAISAFSDRASTATEFPRRAFGHGSRGTKFRTTIEGRSGSAARFRIFARTSGISRVARHGVPRDWRSRVGEICERKGCRTFASPVVSREQRNNGRAIRS